MANLTNSKKTKISTSSVFPLLILLIIIVIFLSRFINKMVSRHLEVPPLMTPPAYLSVPLPDIKEIEKILAHPKLEELRYERLLFQPVQPGVYGKTNPFISL